MPKDIQKKYCANCGIESKNLKLVDVNGKKIYLCNSCKENQE